VKIIEQIGLMLSLKNGTTKQTHQNCNGTRLIITRMEKFVLAGKVISGSNIGEKRKSFHTQVISFTICLAWSVVRCNLKD